MTIDFLTAPERSAASIGILATNEAELQQCLTGLHAKGFTSDIIKIMVIRNYGVNREDGYTGITKFVEHSEGRFLMVLHQDVTPIDNFGDLALRLDELDRLEENWALAGNSGFMGLGRLARRISDPYGADQRIGTLPARVRAVDENVLILNRREVLRPSADLSGFHFYGTDLALQASMAGRGTYVIDWHVRHASGGKMDRSWQLGLKQLEAAYAPRMGSAMIHVPTTILMFGWFRPLRIARKSIWRAVRHGSTAFKRLGLMH